MTTSAGKSAAGEENASDQDIRRATLYRMFNEEHICPFGLKSLDLLRQRGFEIDNHPLRSREETDKFLREHNVETTPQTFIEGKRIGGYDQLREYFGKEAEGTEEGETSFRPFVAISSVAFLMSVAAVWAAFGEVTLIQTLEWFVAFVMLISTRLVRRWLVS